MDEDIATPALPKKQPVQREWCLQRGVARFVKRAVPQPHRFACFDRGAAVSENAFIYEAMRGVVAGEPDSELLVAGLCVKVELKWPPNKPSERQQHEIRLVQQCGHLAGWADSVAAYGALLKQFDVPLLGNWETVARHEDELVAGNIREMEAKAAAPKKAKARGFRGGKPSGKRARPHYTPGKGISTADMIGRGR